MKLKKLEIYGFKSFKDRTEIVFDDGITAIVGPNGCGKSNIADAIRWVMGEQSAKTLRGSVMQDVIFNGTEKEKSLSYCEVSLFFDNTDKTLPLEYDEVVITRKLYRSGESEYYLNKNVCRLKDIGELLRTAQIGRDGYSIIGQGRVEQFISLRPEERRVIFDEATGIAGAKQKKTEAERKLSRTKENLTRYRDILTEIERQLEPMKEQADKAIKYLDLKDKLKYNEVNSFIYRTEQVQSDKEKINLKIKGISEELAAKRENGDVLEKEYNDAFDAISKADERLNQLHEKQLELMIAKEKAESANDLSKQRIDLLTAQNNSFESEIKELQERIASNEERKKTITFNLTEKKNEYAACSKKLAVLTKEADELSSNFASYSEKVDGIREAIANKNKEISLIDNDLVALEKSREYTGAALKDNDNEINSSDDILSDIEKKIVALSNDKTIETQHLSDLRNDLTEKEAEHSHIESELSMTANLINEFEKKKAGYTSQINFLKKMKESYEGFSMSIKKLLGDSKTNFEVKNRIEGVVANLMTVPENLESAIESALGNAMQNIVVRDVEDAKYLIRYLKAKEYGTVTFLPIPFMRRRDLNAENRACLKMNGVLGVASELISYSSKYDNVFSSLLGATVIVDNLDNAAEVARKFNSAFKVVTLDGEVFATGGSITGGGKKAKITNYLSYDREIAELESSIDKVNAKENSFNMKKANSMLKSQSVVATIKSLEREIKESEIKIATISENISSLKSSSTSNKSQVELRAEKSIALNEKLRKIDADIERLKKQRITVESEGFDEEYLKNEAAALESLRVTLLAKNDEVNSERVLEVRINSEISELLRSVETIKSDCESYERQIKTRRESINNNIFVIQKCNETLIDVEGFSKEELQDVEAKLKGIDDYKKEQNAKLKELDANRTECISEIQKLENKIVNLEFDRDKIDSDLSVLENKLQEEYFLDFESALPLKDPEFKLSSSNSEIRKLKDKIYQLGSVNVNAIEDLKGLSGRYDEMNSQKNDMEKAEADLNKVISELAEEMRTKFDEGFKQVNEYFGETFKELFGGGNAKLKLVENDNGDKLSYGVDIEAEPPGKSLQNITLLSGGEKTLTSIAIIISIMKLRPMPFCLLDEIESALDEVNTVRFARYIKNFPGNTQFIMVTHKKSTMEAADRMFGVTMQEKGVSKVVSVKLSDVKDMDEDVA